MLAARIKHTHFYRGMDDIWIDFDHFLFLFHQDALDKSLVSVSVFCQLYTLALLSRLDFSFSPFICNRAG